MKPLMITFALLFAFGPATANACAMKRVRIKAKPVLLVKMVKDAQKAEKKGHARNAIRQYERAMNARGDIKLKAKAAYSAAKLHLAAGNAERAQSRLEKAVTFDSRHAMAHAVLAKLLAERGEIDTARVHLKKAQANGAEIDAVVAAEKAILFATSTAFLGL